MGHVPLDARLLITPKNAWQALALNESYWRSEMRHRHSRFASRRRRAHDACVRLIEALEAACEMIPDPWAAREEARARPPEKPADAARAVATRNSGKVARG